jgi:phosphoribosylformylglycinamidine synthase subunit PurL
MSSRGDVGGSSSEREAPAVAPHEEVGLSDDELERIVGTLGRDPNMTELAMFGAMWSEHCSYKSSKIHLRRLPTDGPRILVGPGQDAGAIDVGDGTAVVFKMESHSHPSAIEPYQGAATGVGGIVRDIISMGARPVALLDPLRFGPLSDERNRWLFGGVVSGIGGYGNCIGVPTVGGEIHFADAHSGNPTVNVMCVGVARADRLMTSARPVHEGSLLVLFGAGTGRDGIGGVSVLASRTLEDGAEVSRPSVQIGDPFAEKLLIEASLELVDRDLLEGLQDLGGAGITCAVSESAARAGLGAELDLDAVPLREPNLEAFEILTSESQERMLAIVAPDDLDAVREVCGRWGLASAVVGRLVPGGRLRVSFAGGVVADVPARSLADDGPEYDRPMSPPRERTDAALDAIAEDPTFATPPSSAQDALFDVLASPNIASKRWVWEQYDWIVQGGTVRGPGSDAAIVRIDGGLTALAVSSDGKGRFGALDPYLGAAHAVAEAARNVAATGATPLAITNCMNFGSPERPEVMWEFAESIRGMADACRALGTPVTGGNVSFYNESAGSSIWPTPVIGMVGLLEDHRLALPSAFVRAGDLVYLLGETLPELGGSEFADVVLGRVAGRPPALDLERERALQRLLIEGASADVLASAHDCGDGGLGVALAEAAIGGGVGFAVAVPGDLPPHVALFAESASRAIVSVDAGRAERLEELATSLAVPFARLGETGGPRVMIDGILDTSVEELAGVYEGALPALLAG